MVSRAATPEDHELLEQTLGLLKLQERSAEPDASETGEQVFVADPGPGKYRLFGGLVAAQSYLAAAQTVTEERRLHSLHAYFVRPGRHGDEIEITVESTRDGGSYSLRRVIARQRGRTIFSLQASFAAPEPGPAIKHQVTEMPDVPPPEQCPDRELERARRYAELGREIPRFANAVEVRLTDPEVVVPAVTLPPDQVHWIRTRGALPEDAQVRTAMLVYASDRSLLSTVALPHAFEMGSRSAASLDHALWLHYPVDLSEWHLMVCHSPVASSSRGVVRATLFRQDGLAVATVHQEALVRRAPNKGAARNHG